MLKRRKECIAMLLAGGQGSRLKVLTENTAKPAVPFGGKYRIIDFPLSNCINSGIDTVGILTQYQPLELNNYIGNGRPWGLDRNFGGAHILPPYSKSKKSEWYKGTANAIYQNMHFIDIYNPEYVLILSGDHIYKMDYNKMLKFHKEKGAECTIAVLDVPLKEASRFGIMKTDDAKDGDKITAFEEKPKKPTSTKASMGIYIFNWKILKQYLIEDEENPKSSNDFGKDIIPRLLEDKKGLYAYQFDGYWKDVGTISSLWEANMDLLDPKSDIKLKDKKFKIYSRNYAQPPSLITKSANITNSYVAEGSIVKGNVKNSIIFTGCVIDEFAEISDSVVMPNTHIGSNASVKYSIIGENVTVEKKCKIGGNPDDYQQWDISVVGKDNILDIEQVVKPGEII
ncbi:MAG: glucose-1-phosphate adenylyltransferase [Ruminococcaceae bacterium]|nr:glucose-1-phosphate adenylyltransferase [Oscillospiraceae bacterium]